MEDDFILQLYLFVFGGNYFFFLHVQKNCEYSKHRATSVEIGHILLAANSGTQNFGVWLYIYIVTIVGIDGGISKES